MTSTAEPKGSLSQHPGGIPLGPNITTPTRYQVLGPFLFMDKIRLSTDQLDSDESFQMLV